MKRHSSLALLSSDHQHGLVIARLLQLAGKVEISGLKGLKDKLIAFYQSDLEIHFAKEEKYLVPPLKETQLIKKMCADHLQIKKLFNMISASDNNLSDNIISFGNFLDSHIRFEERELFPMIEKTLSEKQLEQIGRNINNE
ncbi:MAG: hemerythrin domain-containing protein [Ignavibacteria bacterium]